MHTLSIKLTTGVSKCDVNWVVPACTEFGLSSEWLLAGAVYGPPDDISLTTAQK